MSSLSREGGAPPPPELSRPLAVATIKGEGMSASVEATDSERPRVARRLDVPAIGSLRCRWTLRPVPGRPDAFAADGVLDAVVTRICVVTLDPFEDAVREPFSVVFVPESDVDDESEDDPDDPDVVPYRGRLIDLGEATVEQLALALDPFPRSPEAALAAERSVTDDGAGEGTAGPFAALRSRTERN